VFNYFPIPVWRDLVDILFLSLVAYHLYIWFRETRALRVLIGLVVMGGIYSLAKLWDLFLTTWVFQILWQVLLILLLILFQSEIRQVLEKVSFLRILRSRKRIFQESLSIELAQVSFEMATEKTGALIVLSRDDNPSEFIHSGQTINALPEPSLIKSIFNPHGPIHDGALVLFQGRLTQIGGILPLSERDDVPEQYGTRHRAALGISERTDAVCIVVSEERAEVSTIVGGNNTIWENPDLLASQLNDWLRVPKIAPPAIKDFFKRIVFQNWKYKLGALCIVSMAWLILASQQEIGTSITAPIRLVNLPPDLVLGESSAHSARLTLSGRRYMIKALKDQEVDVNVDLSMLSPGTHFIKLSSKNVDLPLGVTIDRLTPRNIHVLLQAPEGDVTISE